MDKPRLEILRGLQRRSHDRIQQLQGRASELKALAAYVEKSTAQLVLETDLAEQQQDQLLLEIRAEIGVETSGTPGSSEVAS